MSNNLVWPGRPMIFGVVAFWASLLSLGALAQTRPPFPTTTNTTAIAASDEAAATHYALLFSALGARAYLRDLPKAELHLLDTGHFALEDKGAEIAHLIRCFLDRTLRAAGR